MERRTIWTTTGPLWIETFLSIDNKWWKNFSSCAATNNIRYEIGGAIFISCSRKKICLMMDDLQLTWKETFWLVFLLNVSFVETIFISLAVLLSKPLWLQLYMACGREIRFSLIITRFKSSNQRHRASSSNPLRRPVPIFSSFETINSEFHRFRNKPSHFRPTSTLLPRNNISELINEESIKIGLHILYL